MVSLLVHAHGYDVIGWIVSSGERFPDQPADRRQFSFPPGDVHPRRRYCSIALGVVLQHSFWLAIARLISLGSQLGLGPSVMFASPAAGVRQPGPPLPALIHCCAGATTDGYRRGLRHTAVFREQPVRCLRTRSTSPPSNVGSTDTNAFPCDGRR